MAGVKFYLCDVCGHEIDAGQPCHRAIEVQAPDEYLYSESFHGEPVNGRADRYICQVCLPPRRFRTRQQRAREAARGGSLLDMTLCEVFNWVRGRPSRDRQ